MQKFRAVEPFQFSNGATGWRSGGPMDCLGPWAKVQNCPIAGTTIRRTAYATGYADTFFSVPACTQYHGRYITGYFSIIDGSGWPGAVEFRPHTDQLHKLQEVLDY